MLSKGEPRVILHKLFIKFTRQILELLLKVWLKTKILLDVMTDLMRNQPMRLFSFFIN